MTPFKYYLPAFIWASLLFYLSSYKLPELPVLFEIEFSDLVIHFIAYSVLGYFLGIAVFASELEFTQKKIFIAILIGVLYGASDEIHQYFVPGRMCTVSDWVADSLGAAFGVFVFVKVPVIYNAVVKRILRVA